MSEDKGLFDRLKERGDEMLAQVSGELMQNPHFMKAMEGALRGKQRLDEAASSALKSMNIPTRGEFKKALQRIESLEHDVASLKAKLKKAPAGKPRKAAPARK
jgi:polyhydroxyalkanoate synthesis regulator phasin